MKSIVLDRKIWTAIVLCASILVIGADSKPKVLAGTLFTNTGQLLGQANVFTETCGDLDGDGDPDCILASTALNSTIQVFSNNGAAILTDTGQVFPVRSADFPLWNFGIVLVDVNRDGHLDIVSVDAVRGADIFINNGSGFFPGNPQVLFDYDVSEFKGADAGDLDNDGDLDLVIGDFWKPDRVYLNDGSGTFRDSGQRLGLNYHTWKTALGDLDGDETLDLVVASRWNDPLLVYFNNGNGQFSNPGTILGFFDAYDVKLADVNTDGYLDIIVAASINTSTGTLSRIFLNDGHGHFSDSGQNLGTPNCETKEFGIGDLNNDGYLDLILGNYGSANQIYLNDGSGHFVQMPETLESLNTVGLSLVDLNNDGYLDVIAGHLAVQHYKVYLNNGTMGSPNLSPSPPTGLASSISGHTVILTWGNGSDAETPQVLLTYNLRVGRTPGGNEVLSGALPFGFGNMKHAFRKVIRRLPAGTYYWSVQTVDSGFRWSDWATEQTFIVQQSDIYMPIILGQFP
jgi:hypothetical protein